MESFNIGRTLSRTFSLVFATLGSVGLFMLVIQIVSAGTQYLLGGMMQANVAAAAKPGDPLAALAIFQSGPYWMILAVSMLLGSLAIAGSLHGLLQSAWGKPTSLAECFSVGLIKMLPAFGLYLLWILGVGLGWMLLLVPGMILMTMWSAAMPAMVGENIGVFASFGRSRDLTRGSRLKIFVTLLVFMVAIYAVLFGILGAIVGGNMAQFAMTMNSSPLTAAFGIIIGWVFGALLNALLASIYVELVTMKQGGPADHLDEVFG